MPGPRPQPDPSLVALFQARPQIIERVVREHADDGSGLCCRCSSGAQAGRYRHPCRVRLAADEALRRLDQRVDPIDPGRTTTAAHQPEDRR